MLLLNIFIFLFFLLLDHYITCRMLLVIRYNLETEYRLFPPVTIFVNLFPPAGYFFNAFD